MGLHFERSLIVLRLASCPLMAYRHTSSHKLSWWGKLLLLKAGKKIPLWLFMPVHHPTNRSYFIELKHIEMHWNTWTYVSWSECLTHISLHAGSSGTHSTRLHTWRNTCEFAWGMSWSLFAAQSYYLLQAQVSSWQASSSANLLQISFCSRSSFWRARTCNQTRSKDAPISQCSWPRVRKTSVLIASNYTHSFNPSVFTFCAPMLMNLISGIPGHFCNLSLAANILIEHAMQARNPARTTNTCWTFWTKVPQHQLIIISCELQKSCRTFTCHLLGLRHLQQLIFLAQSQWTAMMQKWIG